MAVYFSKPERLQYAAVVERIRRSDPEAWRLLMAAFDSLHKDCVGALLRTDCGLVQHMTQMQAQANVFLALHETARDSQSIIEAENTPPKPSKGKTL